MWLSLLLLALTAGILVRQAQQGLFSAFLMAVLTVCCAAAAIGSYEWVTNHWVLVFYPEEWSRSYCLPIALAALFSIPLIVLRLVFDYFIRRACLLPSLIDRIGAGVCGFVTAMVTVGILALCVQMLPFQNGSIIGYSRVGVVESASSGGSAPTYPDYNTEEKEILHRPDRFAAFVAMLILQGIFGSDQSFVEHNPDLVQTIGWAGAVHREVSRYAPPDSISVERTEPVDFVFKYTPADTRAGTPASYEPQPAKKGEFRMVRVKLRSSARDERKSYIFTLRQFRLVGQSPGTQEGYEQYYPIAIQQEDPNDPENRYIRYKAFPGRVAPVIDERMAPRDGNSNEVEIVFDLPRKFKPAFLEYKREARTKFSFDQPLAATSPSPQPRRQQPPAEDRTAVATAPTTPQPTATPAPPTPSDAGSGTSRRRRRDPDAGRGASARGVAAIAVDSHFGDQLPMTMRAYQGRQDPQINGEVMTRGHLVGEVAQQANGTDPPVSRFMVPEGMRLLHLSAERLTASSIYGRALNQAVTTVQNYYVEDTNGNRYRLIGKYTIATVRRRQYIEVQYFHDQAGSVGGLGKFRRTRERNLTDQDQFVLLFLVDPGVQIVAFSTGSTATRRDDLTTDNLIAPP